VPVDNPPMDDIFVPTRHRLSVDDFHKLGEAGILDEDSRVELIEGELFDMPPIGVPHMQVVNRLNRLLVLAVGDQGIVSVQNPVTLPPHSEPQADVTILKPGWAVSVATPTPDDVLLLVEVADTTLSYDRGRKLRLYARAGLREVWIVDVQGRKVESYRDPTAQGYGHRAEHRPGEAISPLTLPLVTLAIAELF